MSKTIKIIIGVLLSACLFYLFIKDVNEIKIISDSGKNCGEGSYRDRVIYIRHGENLSKGDSIFVKDKQHIQGEHKTIEKIIPLENQSGVCIIVQTPFKYRYLVTDGAYISFPRLQKTLLSANYLWLIPCLLCIFTSLAIRSYRWKFFFKDQSTINFNSLWVATNIGYMANNVLPFRMGEFVRAWFMVHKEKRRISESFATIVMERVFDIISILMLFGVFVFYFSRQPEITLPDWLKDGAWILTGISIVSLMFLIVLHVWTEQSLSFIKVVLRPLPASLSKKVLHIMESFIEGIDIFSRKRDSVVAFGLSLVIWIDLALAYLFIFKAVHIQATLMTSLFLTVALAFAVSIPSAPGFIGTYHFVGKEVLLMMNIAGNVQAYVLLAHAMAYIPVVVIGLIYLSLENISFKEIRKSMSGWSSQKGS